jgi:hypothetical protein
MQLKNLQENIKMKIIGQVFSNISNTFSWKKLKSLLLPHAYLITSYTLLNVLGVINFISAKLSLPVNIILTIMYSVYSLISLTGIYYLLRHRHYKMLLLLLLKESTSLFGLISNIRFIKRDLAYNDSCTNHYSMILDDSDDFAKVESNYNLSNEEMVDFLHCLDKDDKKLLNHSINEGNELDYKMIDYISSARERRHQNEIEMEKNNNNIKDIIKELKENFHFSFDDEKEMEVNSNRMRQLL